MKLIVNYRSIAKLLKCLLLCKGRKFATTTSTATEAVVIRKNFTKPICLMSIVIWMVAF